MLKNNKGITLISVVITVIMMITILSSIIYSNNNSNELKEEMLLNSDIEQLNKKVQLYYLKNKTLPIDESVYLDNEEDGLKYYKLKTSLLENLNLKNLEKIEDEETFTNNDQWYVINKETHLIYFVKYIDGEIKFQEGKYSEKYLDVVKNAYINEIDFGATTDIDIGIIENENKVNIIEGKEYSAYIGWNKSGTRAKNLVLQYDGQYNAIGDDGKPIADTTATTWADLTNNGNNGKLVNGNGYLEYDFRVQSNDNIVERFWDEGTRQIATENYSWEENGRTYS